MDQANGPASRWPDSRAAGKSINGVAAINAGFFTPEGTPLGKVMANGKSTGNINRASSLGSGFYVRSSSGKMQLIRREEFASGQEALQAGPFLVEDGFTVAGLSEKQSTARSFVAWDGKTAWMIGRTGSCSLSDLAKALTREELGSTRLTHVLNLDGGRSSEIWCAEAVENGPFFKRPFWNKPVRNFLVLKSNR